ncbi:uncharacterized protein LOC113138288 [Mastacembelus armatus]|uniref:uncharacterized protein LOC113138288 n=1 Tax=Mastacembelus armatus TaxID=205130 RepID=UPI000E461828|nr:uncharacterized protein LOC113138288 [Mastacembelus armatus]
MAPLCMAGRLSLLMSAMLIFLVYYPQMITSVLVYDRQTLLNLRSAAREVLLSDGCGQNQLPPLFSGPPYYLCHRMLPPRRRRRRRGCRAGWLVRSRAGLRGASTASGTGCGRSPRFCVSWRLLGPTSGCLVPVAGFLEDEGPQFRYLAAPRLRPRGINLRHLRLLPRAPPAVGLQAQNLFPTSFELAAIEIGRSNPVLCAVIYRPPGYNKDFINDFSDFLSEIMPNYDRVLILGDFNIHVCCPDKPLVKDFLNIADSFNLVQSVIGPTHKQGHTLDLVFSFGLPVLNLEIGDPAFSDHMPVLFEVGFSTRTVKIPAPARRCRALNSSSAGCFSAAFECLGPPPASISAHCDDLTTWFYSSCLSVLDSVAPFMTNRPKAKSDPWLNDGTRALRRQCRKAEQDVVGSLNPSGSPHDPAPPWFFKEVFPCVGKLVLNIINSSLSFGVVPSNFKHAVVQPLIKKPSLDPSVLANYRPISRLPFFSKVLEKVVYAQLKAFLDEHEILEIFQSGFKPHHSTESALIKVFNDIFTCSDTGDFVVLILLDLSAAFDTVDHNILISRLHDVVGIRGLALEWFRSYLVARTFSVGLASFESSSAPLSSGVPQGSVLGPLLFSLYLLPLGHIFRQHGISFHFYADDTQVYFPLKKKEGFSIARLLACLDDIKAWMALNFLHFNEAKTEVMLVGSSASSVSSGVNLGPLTSYLIPLVTNLGFKMDRDLKFDKQIGAVVKSVFFHLRRLAKLRPLVSKQHFELVIHAFVTSRLDYCNALYLGVSQASLLRLQLVQNAAARLLTGTRKYKHITPILAALHWLPVSFRVHFKVLLFVFKSLNGLAPPYLTELLHPYTPSRSLRSADLQLLEVPKTRRKLRGDRSFSVAAPRLWNNLPLNIRQAPTLAMFKVQLKTYLYTQAFGPA